MEEDESDEESSKKDDFRVYFSLINQLMNEYQSRKKEQKFLLIFIFFFKKTKKVFIPGRDKLEEGEYLDYDSSSYVMYHSLDVDWPCLSFDILQDRLGLQRTKVFSSFFSSAICLLH